MPPRSKDILKGKILYLPTQRQATFQSPIPVRLSQRSNTLQPEGISGNQVRPIMETDWLKVETLASDERNAISRITATHPPYTPEAVCVSNEDRNWGIRLGGRESLQK